VVGSSGVGKSTIIATLMAAEVAIATAPVRDHDDRGRHATTRRELYVLAGGGVIIDTPGMRELQLWGDDEALGFDDVATVAAACRFSDCRHRQEPGCAVRAAVAAGTLAAARLTGFHKLAAERATALARRRKR
jgi:ribosome biogenesis GTPase